MRKIVTGGKIRGEVTMWGNIHEEVSLREKTCSDLQTRGGIRDGGP
jgi:hypothetical protein